MQVVCVEMQESSCETKMTICPDRPTWKITCADKQTCPKETLVLMLCSKLSVKAGKRRVKVFESFILLALVYKVKVLRAGSFKNSLTCSM